MSAFKRVVLTEKEDNQTQVASDSVVEKQANGFDEYTDQKLNDLYKEFDSITINDTDLVSETIEKNQEKTQISAKVKVRLVAGIVIAALLLFLAIYNIFVINNIKTNIKIINSDIATQETALNNSVTHYEELTDTTNIESELTSNGFSDVSGSTKTHVNVPKTTKQNNAQVGSNWWDSFCNFIASIFGR